MANEKWKKWYEKHKEEYLEKKKAYKKEYYEKNKEEILIKHKEYRKEHKEEKSLRDKKWRENNQDKIIEYRNSKYGRAAILIATYRATDKKQNRGECTLTVEELVEMFNNGCIYCGETDYHKLGADRIDNSKPHTKENCVPCCRHCNCQRGTKDFQEFYNQKFMDTILE